MINYDRGVIGAISKFQASDIYPLMFAAICAISGLCNKYVYIPLLIILSAFVLFSALFAKDNTVFLVPIFMMYYALGTDNKDTYNATNGNVFASIDPDAWNVIVVLAIALVSALVIRFSLDGTFKGIARSKGKAFRGILHPPYRPED